MIFLLSAIRANSLKSGFKDGIPRLCGEKFCCGSSTVLCYRITPAYAGKRKAKRNHVKAMRDHPRLCGEKSSSCMTAPLMSGSPPPMRGKVHDRHLCSGKGRITPAYAGKSPRNRSPQWLCRDHPRLCGEKL